MEALSGKRRGADIVGQRLFANIWTLARQIRTPRTYMGYSFFLLVAIARHCKLIMWEGEQRIDLLDVYSPWAVESAVADGAVEGVVCCMEALPCGNAKMVPVCEEHPLTECKHFLACHQLELELGFDCGDSIESFYGRLGVL